MIRTFLLTSCRKVAHEPHAKWFESQLEYSNIGVFEYSNKSEYWNIRVLNFELKDLYVKSLRHQIKGALNLANSSIDSD